MCSDLGGARAGDIFLAVVKKRHVLGLGLQQVAHVEESVCAGFSKAYFMRKKELIELTHDVRVALHKAVCVFGIGVAERAQSKAPFQLVECGSNLVMRLGPQGIPAAPSVLQTHGDAKGVGQMRRVLGKVDPANFLVFVGLI